MSEQAPVWLVTFTDGTTITVDVEMAEESNGCLILRMGEHSSIGAIFAPGKWKSIQRIGQLGIMAELSHNAIRPKITDAPCGCGCGWWGTVGDCEPDVDGEGSLGCPRCREIVEVIA